ncbi:hypothetical protein B4U80_05905 [Leptotrombidium deliense]|uniref:Uncharacterized protein n=1 Tax=Leptotrombidium deliense TaxID=299467 RepID=A0A443SFB8_9ACAR|nr:hypothetical protein B4U80_05905 [Leptotrombidium deliense]
MILFLTNYTSADSCYFPIEYQGTYLIQTQASASNGGNVVSYSEITIEADAIPPWGRCHKRRGNNVILKDSNGIEDCMRCFHLTLKTPNVIQIHTEGLARCYTNEEAAKNTCPSEKDVKDRKFKEIMLFRKHVPGGLQSVEHVFCPINGRYRFAYTGHNGEFHCDQSGSEISNCPHGNALGVRFRHCSFPNMDTNFLCLGDWENYSGDRYLALMDLREDPKSRPKYRCGMYREEASTGRIFLSLSADSTCLTQLKSATNGFESLVLTPVQTKTAVSLSETSKCRFPEWSQGKWENTKIEGNTLKFKDQLTQFRTLASKCISRQNNTPNDRFIVQISTQWYGDEFYTCIWMKRRSPNILEFQFGTQRTDVYSDHLCEDMQFTSHSWYTQGKKNIAIPTACPITGDYMGVVPGVTGLCAKVASDCNNPDIMFYTVSSCENRSHIFEEREYRCLGNWEEDGILYTHTQRRDMPGHQCFTGKIMKNGEEVFIKEAGESCIRGEDPLIFGMKITKQASCPRLLPVASYVPIRTNWPLRADKMIPHKVAAYPPIRAVPQQTAPQPIIPAARPAVTKDPHWYQAEMPSTKPWKPIISE